MVDDQGTTASSRPEGTPDDVPDALRDASEAEEFLCDNCGARMRWDPDADALLCEHCDHLQQVAAGSGTVLERPLEEAGDAARGLGLEVRVLRCDECGAQVTLEGMTTTDRCVYCDSAQVLAQDANRNALRPESLVPLDVGRKNVEKAFRKWLGGLWFRPTALKTEAKKRSATGIYVPFWTFDCQVHSDWTASSGTYYYVTVTVPTMVNGKMKMRRKRVRKIRWRPAAGQRDDVYDDLLVAASRGIPAELVARLGRFDTTALVPYRPEYLAGWRAEEYQLDLMDGWAQGQRRIEETQERRCGHDVPGDTYRFLQVHNRIREVRWKHVLLPVWSLAYTFQGRHFRVLVHGQTGRVVGEAPYSWIKIGLAVLALAGAIGAVVVASGGI